MKKYNLINNSLGWLCFIIAAVTYILTLEPTASFWDCPEFILQGYKLEIGHPPGNPIFMLAARFFTNFAFGDVTKVAYMVNLMSALLSAGTILLLFWTITHLVKRLIVADDATEVSLTHMLVIFGSGLCGALMFTWSDTFWFSAVEGEVYAFSSFCTALVVWLILKWENRADEPHADRYLILIAYVIGVSIAVHLLNLLCIPAIVLVIYYKKWKETTAKGSLIALLISFVIVALILFGLVPGFVRVAQYFELFFVNKLHMSYNSGVLIYAILFVVSSIFTIHSLYKQENATKISALLFINILLSGMLFIGNKWWLTLLLILALGCYFLFTKKLPVRILTIVALSVFVIFIGYSSYALLLIRSSAHPPMNQSTPDNVFALSSYLSREQYGDTPLLFGPTLNSQPVYKDNGTGSLTVVKKEGAAEYAKKVKESPNDPDEYILTGHKPIYMMTPELNMLFPRIHSATPPHPQAYSDWIGGMTGTAVNATKYLSSDGEPLEKTYMIKPTMGENISFFLNYQLNHMYWRYFLWNFAGRQNDLQGNGEVNQGNWISGIPVIDNYRLGDQSLLPDSMGKGNAGHNVYFMLPLLMGILGLCWQAFVSKRGIEQFWVVFFLFFMTGIAIVLYLNQTPAQVRERDYAFAGSFYAFAIWVGMGVAAIWQLICSLNKKTDEKNSKIAAIVATIVGIIVPLQVVSQTWDDHDRSGRYTARDFGRNYLESLDENAIIFTNGDNDTFPLWYAQEVEGIRTDVKVVNLSYLTTDWYINQIRRPSYDAPGIDMMAQPKDYAYGNLTYAYAGQDSTAVNALASLQNLYSPDARVNRFNALMMKYPVTYIPVDTAAMIRAGRIAPNEAPAAEDYIFVDMLSNSKRSGAIYINEILPLDMLATSAANGWNRPIYFATTVPESYYIGLSPYMQSTGMAYEVTPFLNRSDDFGVNTDKTYRNVTERFSWGGLDKVTKPGQIYLDETISRMVMSHRGVIIDLARALTNEAVAINIMLADSASMSKSKVEELKAERNQRYDRAEEVLKLMEEKLPAVASPYGLQISLQLADIYYHIGAATGKTELTERARAVLKDEIDRDTQNILYYQSLSPRQYSTLPNIDLALDRRYFMHLLYTYVDYFGEDEELLKELTERGVDLYRLETLYRQTGGAQ